MELKTILFFIFFLPLAVFAQTADSNMHIAPPSEKASRMPDTGFHANGLKKQVIINAGFAWSSGITYIMELIHGANPDAGLGAAGPNSFNVGATYHFGADYGISYRTTVGLAISYVQVTGNYDSLGTKEKFTRLNIGARLLYHFTKNCARKDWYCGIRWGLSFWADNLPALASPVEYYESYFSPNNPIEPSIQILLGWRRWFTYGFGINIEAAVGTPYFLEGGLTFRLGNHAK